MPIPTFVAAGAWDHTTTGTLTPPLPSGWAIDDILLILYHKRFNAIETAPTDWATLGASPSVSNGKTIVFWKRAVSGETTPTHAGGGNAESVMLAYRGCVLTGTPYEAVVTGSDSSADTSFSSTGLTTLGTDRLVVVANGGVGDTTGEVYSGWAGTGLTDVTERVDRGYTDGSGGLAVLADGGKAATGACGPFTATISVSRIDQWVEFALIPSDSGATRKGSRAILVG